MMDKVMAGKVGKEMGPKEAGVEKKAYTYDEALDLAGNGCYNLTLLATLSLTLSAMCLDMFSFSVVVNLASCDLNLDLSQKSILLSIPFIGPIVMAYAWGYISDTKGRKYSLLIGLTGGFVMSTLCAFATNWIVLAVFKLIGTCLCSCAQSGTYTLLGESCCERVKGTYMLVMTSVIHMCSSLYFALGYFIGNLTFIYDLGFITFVPWRLLVIVLALPLGLSSISLMFFHESPKFLVNDDREDQALKVLRCISRRNGIKTDYPVQTLVLNEDGNVRNKDVLLLRSLWEQTAPLFKPPLLFWTLLLFYLIIVVYASSSSLYVWMPFLTNAIISGGNSSSAQNQGLCSVITQMNSVPSESKQCSSAIDVTMVYATFIASCCYSSLNIIMSRLASRKRALTIVIFSMSLLCALLTVTIPHRVSGFFYFGIMVSGLGMGLIFSYYVDLFPTSFRGMASCLGVMVCRTGSVLGINIVGPFILSNCTATFYGLCALIVSGILAACLLPPDRPKKVL